MPVKEYTRVPWCKSFIIDIDYQEVDNTRSEDTYNYTSNEWYLILCTYAYILYKNAYYILYIM
jgi:hypothetical protein